MFENKVTKAILGVYYMALAFMMYYFIEQILYVPIGISYRHLFALAIIVSTFILFVVNPRVNEAIVTVKSALMFAVPLFVVLIASMAVWVIDGSAVDSIERGLSGCFFFTNWLSCALCATSLLYIFGESGIWLNLVAILASNLTMIAKIIVKEGAGNYFGELYELIVSFADKTGDVIVQAEIHELAFCIGAYIVYMLCKPKKKVWFWVLFALSVFCFVSALKRIAVIAVAVAVLFKLIFLLFGKISSKALKNSIAVVMIVAVILLIAYVAVIESGLFTKLEDSGKISTNGRSEIYEWAGKYYDFSPMFYGRGIGFLTYSITNDNTMLVATIHNDFIQFFIDLGFVGYILWLWSITLYRTSYFSKRGDTNTAVIACVLTLYMLICSTTDNTVNYPLLTTVMAILIIGNGYNTSVDKEKELLRKRGREFR